MNHQFVCNQRVFSTLDAALAYASLLFQRTGVIAGVEKILKNPLTT